MNEQVRLKHLSARDGQDVARQWAQWAAGLYRQSINDPKHYASQPDWKPLFERSILELAMFAESGILS